MKWHFTDFRKREIIMKNPSVTIIKQYSRINSCVEYLLMWRHLWKRWLAEELPVLDERVGVNLSILVKLWWLANKYSALKLNFVLSGNSWSFCAFASLVVTGYDIPSNQFITKNKRNMSSSIIASRDVNELPPIVVVLGGCTWIKSVSD